MKTERVKIKLGRKFALAALLQFFICIFNCEATPFFIQGFQSDSPALTNQIGVAYWPPSDHPFSTYGTNIIYGGNIVTITPNASGYASNWLYPGTYRFYITNLNAAFVAAIPDTTNFNSLAMYVTNVPGFSGVGLNSYGVATNLLGLAPATNSYAGIVSALGFAPATNSFIGSTNALGYAPATNSNSGIISALGFIPSTNNFAGITNSLGFAPATNSTAGLFSALGYTPATNNYSGLTNSLGFPPATNSSVGVIAALQYTPRTNDGYVGLSSLAGIANLTTNGFLVWIAYQTNGVPGTAFTNLPAGSLLTTTNGQLFVLSNLVWNVK